MNKKKRIAVAYLVSFLLNGIFWLVYARELRQASANPSRPPSVPNKFKPLVLGQFKPLPPLPRREVPPPATLPARSPSGTAAKTAGADGKPGAADSSRSASLSGRPAQTASAAGASSASPGPRWASIFSTLVSRLRALPALVSAHGGHSARGRGPPDLDRNGSRREAVHRKRHRD